ncbi:MULTISPECIES: hypothetical protein [Streptacidiphilus]|uniref:Ig-like domain repeat protein n=2 Tax=Streptacidiphilus TaxID=228398 RepID=A0ABV6UGN4_9ACTN|nr:hypothetical protein [Streptacidiphilus jeojiense]
MKLSALSTAIAVVAGSVSAGVIGAAGSAGAAEPAAVPLSLSHYSHLLVDAAHQHLYFSQGSGTSTILVTDLSGHDVGTIDDEQGATALALSADGSTLYAALSDGDAVAAIDTTSLTEKARYATGASSAPASLAVSGGKVWYSYTTAADAGGIGVIDAQDDSPAATAQPTMSTWASAPVLASASASDELVAEDFSAQHMATFGQTSGTPVLQADGTVATGNTTGSLQVSPDGTEVLAASPGQALVKGFTTAGLAATRSYGATQTPSVALAVAADGTIATGTAAADGTDLITDAATGNQLNSVDLHNDGTTDRLAPDGLAWMPDNIGAYAVTSTSGGGYGLHLVPDARVTTVYVILGWNQDEDQALPGQDFTVQGSAWSTVPLPTGTALQVSRDGAALPDVHLAADGTFSFKDNQSVAGTYDYTVSYPGDTTHRSGNSTVHVTVQPYTSRIVVGTLSATPSLVKLNGSLMAFNLAGHLMTAPPIGTAVAVSRTDLTSGQTVQLPSVDVTSSTGTFQVLDAPQAAHSFVYHLSYPGATTYTAAGTDVTVKVAPLAPTVSLSAPSSQVRNGQLTVKGGLNQGPYPTGETVKITRIDPAHPSGVSLGTVAVAGDGTFSFTDAPHYGGTNTYTVTYAGDPIRSSAVGSANVKVSYSTPYLSVHTNASTFTYGTTATVTAQLGSTYANRAVTIYAQRYGGSRTAIATGTVNSSGKLTASYRVIKGTTFTAAFTGDFEFAPATVSTGVHVYASLAEHQSGYYTTTSSGGTKYAVYHHTAKPAVSTTVYPGKPAECVKFQLQEYLSGAWRTINQSGCYALNSSSTASRSYTLPSGATGHLFRWNAAYFHSSTDQANLNTTGAWQYFTVKY